MPAWTSTPCWSSTSSSSTTSSSSRSPGAWVSSSAPSARACARRRTIACPPHSPTCRTSTRRASRSREQLGFTDLTDEERARFKPVGQRLVRVHPSTGRKSLFLASHAGTIVGWPVPEARLLLRDLIAHATQKEFVYAHEWRVGDLVIWDNRRTMHRG